MKSGYWLAVVHLDFFLPYLDNFSVNPSVSFQARRIQFNCFHKRIPPCSCIPCLSSTGPMCPAGLYPSPGTSAGKVCLWWNIVVSRLTDAGQRLTYPYMDIVTITYCTQSYYPVSTCARVAQPTYSPRRIVLNPINRAWAKQLKHTCFELGLVLSLLLSNLALA